MKSVSIFVAAFVCFISASETRAASGPLFDARAALEKIDAAGDSKKSIM